MDVHDVVRVRWPAEAALLEAARAAGRPRLVLVEGDAAPPDILDDIEDWSRVPAHDRDLRARARTLQDRFAARRAAPPDLDKQGVLRFGGRWVPLAPLEARLAAALIARFGAVVSRPALTRAGWPGGEPGRNTLDVHIHRLRRRVAKVGLDLRNVRARGYLLEPATFSLL